MRRIKHMLAASAAALVIAVGTANTTSAVPEAGVTDGYNAATTITHTGGVLNIPPVKFFKYTAPGGGTNNISFVIFDTAIQRWTHITGYSTSSIMGMVRFSDTTCTTPLTGGMSVQAASVDATNGFRVFDSYTTSQTWGSYKWQSRIESSGTNWVYSPTCYLASKTFNFNDVGGGTTNINITSPSGGGSSESGLVKTTDLVPLYKVLGGTAALLVVAGAMYLVLSPFMKRHLR